MPEEKTSLLQKLATIGYLPDDTEEVKLHKRFLVYMGTLMSGGGLMWGSISSIFELHWQSLIPYGYTFFTILNFTYFRFSKKFKVSRFFQVTLSLLLPFMFQWSLGGFAVTGAMMLWSLLALVGSMTFQNIRTSSRWLIAYIVLTVISGFIDPYVKAAIDIGLKPTDNVVTFFFVADIIIISSIVVGLMLYFMHSRDEANKVLSELKDKLEVLVESRTKELNETLARLSAIIDNLADGLLVTDNEGRISRINPALAKMYEITHRSQVLGKPGEFMDPAVALLVNETLQHNNIAAGELELPNNRTGKAVATSIIAEGQNGEVYGSVAIIRDITEEKEVDRMKTDFISNVSHELRTPLTSVLGFAKIITKKFGENIVPNVDTSEKKTARSIKQVSENLDIIVSEGTRLTALINGVLDISKMEAGKTEWNIIEISLEDIIDRSIAATSALFENKPFEIQKEVESGLPSVMADPDRIQQVCINLISNAVKFTEEGEIKIKAGIDYNSLKVSVIDSGIGLTREDQKKVFNKFQQVGDTLTDKPQGTGLGLPISKQIIEHHGGDIWAEGEVGQGSTFTFTLPVQKGDAGMDSIKRKMVNMQGLIDSLNQHSEEHAQSHTSTGKTIMVVDDERHIRRMLGSELQDAGYNVVEAEDGVEAIKLLKKNPVDLIILDIMMPKMNGFDVAAILKNDPETMKIPIMIHSVVDDEERGYKIGVDKYISKTGNTENILGEVSNLIEQGPSHKSILVMDENESTVESLVGLLSARGYNAVGAYSGDKGLEIARKEKPDLVIVDALFSEKHKLVNTLKFEKGFENLFFLILGDVDLGQIEALAEGKKEVEKKKR